MPRTSKETGYTGLLEFNGQIQDDFLREFRGKEAYKRYDEMRRNSPIIGAGLSAIEYTIRNMSWEFSAEDNNYGEDETMEDPRVQLLEDAKENMSHSWNDFISEVLSMTWAGFSMFNIVYEYDETNRVLWRKFATRGQDTVFRWLFDENGGLAGVQQMAAPNYKVIDIPITELLLFRTRVERNNPEGKSLLRTAWIPYYYAKNLMQIEAIGFERDLNGLPVITLPPGASTDENNANSDASKAAKVVRNLRNDEQSGVVLPNLWQLALLSGSSKGFDALSNAIERYESRMLLAFMSQFLLLGQDGTGSYSLSKDQTDFFIMATNSIADVISETFTKYAIPRLLKLNGYDAEGVCLEHTPANKTDITVVSSFLQSVQDKITWSPDDELWLRQVAGLPERTPEEILADKEEKQARAMEIAKGATPMEQPQDQQQDNNRPGEFAAAPSDDKRLQLERKLKRIIQSSLDATKERVMKGVKDTYGRP